ncbi:MAG: agmatinase [Candidatus Micrarchaeales archaeon]|jgi:agmatinase, putative|uniref:Agmatinase n=1 Tax=Candidatus Micrarchaeum acidiphilum ARMAN-2 TaxID=425595 RepID=C7DGT1_MICA2|nr:MAG: agmatinase [Candidatus Micrarchaeum acidiphilum ARMAN-2]MCW6161520.1 agmatinase [Candidatus Micrarchaeales archaeon]
MEILNKTPPYNLFGLEAQNYENAKFAVLLIPYDSTVSYRTGAREGPHAIINASRNIELYSELLSRDFSDVGIFTLDEMMPNFDSPKKMVERVAKETGLVIDDRKVPILLGGEHTIAVGAVKAFADRGLDFSVLHFDAHSDSRDEFMGTKYSHACVMKRIGEMCSSHISVGVRSIDAKTASSNSNDILFMKDMHGMTAKQIAARISKSTKKNLYVTVDFDVFDPAEMPSVGTPEPDGMHFHDFMEVVGSVFPGKTIIGMDFTELCPIPSVTAPDYFAAKLIYNSIGYAIK